MKGVGNESCAMEGYILLKYVYKRIFYSLILMEKNFFTKVLKVIKCAFFLLLGSGYIEWEAFSRESRGVGIYHTRSKIVK